MLCDTDANQLSSLVLVTSTSGLPWIIKALVPAVIVIDGDEGCAHAPNERVELQKMQSDSLARPARMTPGLTVPVMPAV